MLLYWLSEWITNIVHGGKHDILEDNGAYYQAVRGNIVMWETYQDAEHNHECYSVDIWGVLHIEINCYSWQHTLSIGVLRFSNTRIWPLHI